MLEASWEAHATELANCADDEVEGVLAAICRERGIVADGKAVVLVAIDTRPSGSVATRGRACAGGRAGVVW